MSLRRRILLALTLVVGVLVGLEFLLQQRVIHSIYGDLEEHLAQHLIDRSTGVVEREVDALHTASALFALTQNQENVSSVGEALTAQGNVDLVALYDANGVALERILLDPESRQALEISQLPVLLSSNSPLMHRMAESSEDAVSGLLMTDHGPMLCSSRSIETASGLVRLVIGRFLDTERVQEISAQAGAALQFWTVGVDLPANERAGLEKVMAEGRPVVAADKSGMLGVFYVLSDLSGNPTLLVRSRLKRNLRLESRSHERLALISQLCTSILLILVLGVLLDHIVLQPIARLTYHAVTIGQSEGAVEALELHRDDEIGQLCFEFQHMVYKLEQSREQNIELARISGRSEVATRILHGVGNTLTSVRTSAGETNRILHETCLEDLERLASVVKENPTDFGDSHEDGKGNQLGQFLEHLSSALRHERTLAMKELRVLGDGIDRINGLIAAQEDLTRRSGVRTWTTLTEVMEEALNVSTSQCPELDLSVVREYEELPRARVDRGRMVQVLSFLICNAIEAIAASENVQGQLVLRVRRADGRLRYEVSDNGVGISLKEMGRIFRSATSTKPTHAGDGLHDAANVARTLGGTITADSSGPGTGAEFVLDLPDPIGGDSRQAA